MSSLAVGTIYDTLLDFLGRLETQRVPYTLTSVRPQAIMVQFALPGERWEVEFLADGLVEVERFRSNGSIADESAFEELWQSLSDEPT